MIHNLKTTIGDMPLHATALFGISMHDHGARARCAHVALWHAFALMLKLI